MTLVSSDPEFRERVRRYALAQPFLMLLGVQIARIEAGAVDYRLPFRPDLGQQNGFFHGGAIAALAEAVMGAAAATLAPTDANVVGAQISLNLLKPAAADAIVANGRVVRAGKQLIVCRAEVLSVSKDGKGELCAIAQGAMAVAKT